MMSNTEGNHERLDGYWSKSDFVYPGDQFGSWRSSQVILSVGPVSNTAYASRSVGPGIFAQS